MQNWTDKKSFPDRCHKQMMYAWKRTWLLFQEPRIRPLTRQLWKQPFIVNWSIVLWMTNTTTGNDSSSSCVVTAWYKRSQEPTGSGPKNLPSNEWNSFLSLHNHGIVQNELNSDSSPVAEAEITQRVEDWFGDVQDTGMPERLSCLES